MRQKDVAVRRWLKNLHMRFEVFFMVIWFGNSFANQQLFAIYRIHAWFLRDIGENDKCHQCHRQWQTAVVTAFNHHSMALLSFVRRAGNEMKASMCPDGIGGREIYIYTHTVVIGGAKAQNQWLDSVARCKWNGNRIWVESARRNIKCRCLCGPIS